MTASSRILLRLSALGLMVALMAACSGMPESSAKILRVKYYHLVPDKPFVVNDQAIMAERAYHLHGAVTKAETLARGGHYYTLSWRAKHPGPLRVRFEYRQANAGLKPKVKEIDVPVPGRSNLSKFEVIGEEYAKQGRVTAWKLSIVDASGRELAAERSYLWN